MDRVLSVLRAAGILVGAWALLGLVAWVAGVLPEFPGRAPVESSADGGSAAPPELADAGVPAPAVDAGAPVPPSEAALPPSEPPEPTIALLQVADVGASRVRVCDPSDPPPSLDAVSMFGNLRRELLVGCGAQSHLLALQSFPGPSADFVRIARFDYGTSLPTGGRQATWSLVHDLTDDRLPDVLLATTLRTSSGATRGGSLHLLAGHSTGVFEIPQELGSLAAVGMQVGDLQSEPGLELLVLNAAAGQGRGAGELWVFQGGASPTRLAKIPVVKQAQSFVALDLDRDEHLDVVVVGGAAPEAAAYFGDGTGQLKSDRTFPFAGLREVLAADLDGDGAPDLVLRGDALSWIRAGHREELSVAELAPTAFAAVKAVNLDGDPANELLALGDDTLFLFDAESGLRPLYRVPPELHLEDFVAAELDASAGVDVAFILRQEATAPWELLVLPTLAPPTFAIGPRRDLRDAPLSLRIRLP